jgi:hypothetical protein
MSVPANFFDTYTVTASPADNTETVIATLSGLTELLPNLPVHLHAWANITGEASATDMRLRIRRTSLTGTSVVGPFTCGVTDVTAAAPANGELYGVDTPGDFAGQVYVLTVVMTAAGGTSTVNAVALQARVG